jgi:alanine racemase
LTVDLSHVPDAQLDDKVVLWGEGLPVTSVAIYNQMSAYELLTRMTARAKVDYQ